MDDPFVNSSAVGTMQQGDYKHAVMRKILNESGVSRQARRFHDVRD